MAWKIYDDLKFMDKKIMGDQFIRSADSVGANIAEGYARYHYLEKIKFYYISRGSLSESCSHWLELLHERKRISDESLDRVKKVEKDLRIRLANFINENYRLKSTD